MDTTEPNTRKRKLQAEHQQRAYNYKVVPSLHLAGVWLEQNGFRVGEQVEITVKQNELIIKTNQQ